MNEKIRKLAVIKRPKALMEDHCGKVFLVIETYVSEGVAAAHWLPPKDAGEFLAAYGTYDLHDLEDKVCWVDDDGQTLTNVQPAVF